MKILESALMGNDMLRNRIIMAPMTRSRANENGIIGQLASLYYEQRAGAGLIISEAINISEQAKGMPNTPGIYTREQGEAWLAVTEAVHLAGGKIYAQLNHAGRIAHSLNRNGRLPVAPSAIAIKGQQAHTSEGLKDYEMPIALEVSGIREIIQDYRQAAINAMDAGFDGVELHAALGYLPNQFLVESANQRTDEYGGSIEFRSRFVLETVQAIIDAIGSQKTGIKLSPSLAINNMLESKPVELYSYLVKALDKMDIAYFHFMQPLFPLDELPHYPKDVLTVFAPLTTRNIIVNGGYNRESAENEIRNKRAQFVSFGSLFLANPDLPKRFELSAKLNEPDRSTMYAGGGAKGYTDYPALK